MTQHYLDVSFTREGGNTIHHFPAWRVNEVYLPKRGGDYALLERGNSANQQTAINLARRIAVQEQLEVVVHYH